MRKYSLSNRVLFLCLLCLYCSSSYGQHHKKYDVSLIPDSLKANAYAVLRYQNKKIEIPRIDELIEYNSSAVTVIDTRGMEQASFVVGYKDGFDKVKNIRITILDSAGNVIKKVKADEIQDNSAYDGFSIAQDYRYKMFLPLGIQLPFTIVSSYEFHSKNTVAFSNWPRYFPKTSIQKTQLYIDAYDGFDLSYKAKNFERFHNANLDFEKNNFTIENIIVQREINYAQSQKTRFPTLLIAPKQFSFVSKKGMFTDWKSYGNWLYSNYLYDKCDLKQENLKDLNEQIAGVEDEFEKAKIIYEYVVNNTRYVSIQLKDGGQEPFYASEVHSKKYGDCKALTCYTKNLMDIFEIESYYTIVEAGNSSEADFEENFASLNQGNHVILTLPMDGDTIWAECTSNRVPFGSISEYTADRRVLLINERGGEIIKTSKYRQDENKIKNKVALSFKPENLLTTLDIDATFSGRLAAGRFGINDALPEDELIKKYKKIYTQFDTESVKINNAASINKDSFNEKLEMVVKGLVSKTGNYFFVPLCLMPRSLPKVDPDRSVPILIEHGFIYETEYRIHLDHNFIMPFTDLQANIESEFGAFKIQEERLSDTLVVQLYFELYEGEYPKEAASAFNRWVAEIHKIETKDILLTKKENNE